MRQTTISKLYATAIAVSGVGSMIAGILGLITLAQLLLATMCVLTLVGVLLLVWSR